MPARGKQVERIGVLMHDALRFHDEPRSLVVIEFCLGCNKCGVHVGVAVAMPLGTARVVFGCNFIAKEPVGDFRIRDSEAVTPATHFVVAM